jgi:hypothetical protein
MAPAERDRTIQELLSVQRADGGWGLSSLGSWKRRNGQPNDKEAASEGYGTGLVVKAVIGNAAGTMPSDPGHFEQVCAN